MEEDRTRLVPSRQPVEAPAYSPAPAPPPPPPAPAPRLPASPAREAEETIRFRPPSSAGAFPRAQEPDPVTGWLVVMKGAGRGRSLPLGYGLHSVGRGEDQRVSLQFGDKGISRRNHVIVSYDDQGRRFYVSPGHGAAIAYLNGQPILQPFPLQAGDRVLVGKTEFVLVPFCGPAFDWQEP